MTIAAPPGMTITLFIVAAFVLAILESAKNQQ